MSTLCLNLGNLAVTEYSTDFTGLAGDTECTVDGVFLAGGETDNDARIPTLAEFGLLLGDGARRQRAQYVYVHGESSGNVKARVTDSRGNSYSYGSAAVHDRTRRFVLGRGIRDNYLKVALVGTGANVLAIDRIEFETAVSSNRRL